MFVGGLDRNGDTDEAKFCLLIRRWYEAKDSPAIPIFDRISMWLDLRYFLLKGVDFSNFPSPSLFINGLSVVAFEGFLTGVDTKIQLTAYTVFGPPVVYLQRLSFDVYIIQDMNINNTPLVRRIMYKE